MLAKMIIVNNETCTWYCLQIWENILCMNKIVVRYRSTFISMSFRLILIDLTLIVCSTLPPFDSCNRKSMTVHSLEKEWKRLASLEPLERAIGLKIVTKLFLEINWTAVEGLFLILLPDLFKVGRNVISNMLMSRSLG